MVSVVHLVDEYLPRSQTFIYQYLSRLSASQSIVITRDLSNMHLFPLSKVFELKQPKVIHWLYERLFLRSAIDSSFLDTHYEKICREFKPLVIHAHFGHVGYRALTLKRKLNAPLITTFYGFDMSMLPRRFAWYRAYQKLFQEGDLFLVEGPIMAKMLEQLGCPSNKVIVQPIAIDVTKITATHKSQKNNSSISILMAGRLVEKKGHIYALRAFAQIAKKYPSVELRIVGDGPLKQNINNEIQNLNINDRVHLLGAQDYDRYLLELRNCDIFLSPSVTASNGDSEGGAPTTILEAQATGIPIVSTYHADIPTIVQDGITGFLVAERNVDGLVENLDWLLSNQSS